MARRKTSFSIFHILMFLALVAGARFLYSEWQFQKELVLIRQEHVELLANEKQYLAAQGEVLSGSTPGDAEKIAEKVKLPIVMYHYVENVKDQGDTIRKSLNIPPYLFEKQMKDLHDAKYETYFARDIPTILLGVNNISTRSAVITFDDGYEDFYTDAFPIMKKYKIKSTIYVVYNFIGRKGFMNKAQIGEVANSGLVELASHGVDHIGLKGLDKKATKYQLKESKNILEETFGQEIETYAYPYGSFDEQAEKLAQFVGYTAAVSTLPGAFHHPDELYELRRLRAGMFGDQIVQVMDTLSR